MHLLPPSLHSKDILLHLSSRGQHKGFLIFHINLQVLLCFVILLGTGLSGGIIIFLFISLVFTPLAPRNKARNRGSS